MSTQTDTPATDAAAYDVIYRGAMGCTLTASDKEPGKDGDHVSADFARTLERRAIAAEAFNKQMADVYLKASGELQAKLRAAEAKLAKWESELSKVMPQDFKDWWQNSREEWPEIASMVIEGLRKQVEMTDKAAEARVKELEAALRLRPIAGAGPVPEGAVRLWASYIEKMQDWSVYSAFTDPSEFDTHFIDIYPPQQ